ncbi:MAG TPA: hypothetical protein VFB22_15020 [Candidatus Baltobacteraceae bacterium]|nr:hypothetical protein [Candidatus Baltobacteraceae bacterium]
MWSVRGRERDLAEKAHAGNARELQLPDESSLPRELTAIQTSALRDAAKLYGFPPTLVGLRSLSADQKREVKRFFTLLLQQRGLSDDGVNELGRDVDDLIDMVGC